MKEIKVNRQQQREATKQKIMKAALEGFSQKGFYGTSIKDIYDSIDVASGLLYHYFPGGKEELFKTISEDALITLEAEIARHKNEFEKMPILDVLENIYQLLERLFKKYGKHIKVLTVAYWMSDLSYKEEVQRMVQQSDAWLPAFLQRKSDQGEIGRIDADSTSKIIMSLFRNHFMAEFFDIGQGILHHKASRNKLFTNVLTTWKRGT